MCPYIIINELKLSLFPFILLAAFYLCIFYCASHKRYDIGGIKRLQGLLLFCMFFVVAVGKLLYALTQGPQSLEELFGYIVHGGFVFYGGLIGGCIGLLVYCRTQRLSFFEHSDVFLSVLPLGQAIGRIGCFLNGCCYGIPSKSFLSVPYPVNGTIIPVLPTWFFESLFTFILFLYFHFSKQTIYRGQRTGIYLVLYSAFRFAIEFLRGDVIRGYWNGLSTSQWISLAMEFLGVVIFICSTKKKTINQSIIQGRDCYAV